MSELDFSNLSPSDLEQALDGSAINPPPGVVPDFEHPPNKNTVALFSLLICLTASTLSLAIRTYVRFIKLKQRHIGDYLIIVAYILYLLVIQGSLRRVSDAGGLFVHEWNMRGRDMSPYLIIIFLGMCFWVGTMMLIKSSILIEWIRIFAPTNRQTFFPMSCKILLVFNIGFYVSIFVALNLTCFPYRRIWDKTVPGTCIDIKIVNLVAIVINFLLNIAILILPQRIIWKLHMSTSKKIGISAVFAVGIFACVAAGGLLQAISGWILSEDMSYHYSGVALWAIAESTCGILIFCVPAAPSAFRDWQTPRWFLRLKSWVESSMKNRRRSMRRDQRPWPRTTLASMKPHEYESINEAHPIVLQEMSSMRPTDQQYGIICTTDILITESYDRRDQPNNGYPWNSGN